MGHSLLEKYRSRYVANAALLTIVSALAWLWFTAHVKPHISTLIFSGVSMVTFVGVAAAVFGSFFEKGEANNIVRGLLHSENVTPVLVAALPLIVFAYVTTFTLDLTAGNNDADVRLNVTSGNSSTPVVLSASEKQKAVSYFFAFRPVTAHIETLAPSGYKTLDLPLRRGFPAQLNVPVPGLQKTFYVVRLVPLYDLFQLRGRREPDMSFVVRVFVPGMPKPIEHSGLSFRAIYLGARLADLQSESRRARSATADLRNTLSAIDGGMKPREIDGIVSDWLDNPEFIPTAELKPGDIVRVVVESPSGKSETMVNVAAPINTVLLKGAAE